MILNCKLQTAKALSLKLLPLLFLFPVYSEAQNTIPTTTCTGALKINDSLNVNKNISAVGDITTQGDVTTQGEVISKDTMRAQKDIIVDGNAKIAGDLTIAGKSTFDQEITINKSVLFTGGNEFSFTPATSSTPSKFYLGQSTFKIQPWFECASPSTSTLPQFLNNGKFIARVPLGTGTGLTNSALSFYSAPWNGSGIIEVDGVDNNGGGDNGLMINYFCGRNTYINTNNILSNGGGIVYMGKQVAMANSARIGWDGSNPIDLNSNLSIHTASGNAIKCVTWNNGAKVLTVVNGNFAKSPFTVYGDGKTRIGIRQPLSTGAHQDALLSVDGKILATSVYITNAGGIWADYVFEKDYKKLSFDELNNFLITQKHLPGVPTAKEVETNGQDLGTNQIKLLEKIEESYLYIIELHKRIEALEQKNKEYESKIK